MGERGDWGREHVLDPVMLSRVTCGSYKRALDVGCGEGRFCRTLKQNRVAVTGIDPTTAMIEEARQRDPGGDYRVGRAEQLPFEATSFDLVVSYLTLIDIPDFRAAIREMARVLRPGGSLLVANLTSFSTAKNSGQSWIKDADGSCLYYPIDRYLDEFPEWFQWAGIRVQNWHRPLSAYMKAFLENGLHLSFFDEPEPVSGEPSRAALYKRMPYFLVMEWRRPLDEHS